MMEEDEYTALSGVDPRKAQQKRVLMIGVGVVAIIVLLIVGFIVGYMTAYIIHDDSSGECSDSSNSASSSATVSVSTSSGSTSSVTSSSTPSLLSSASASPSPIVSINTNAKDQDINQRYFQETPKHPFSIEDLVRTDRISEPVTSPDGAYLVFSRYVFNPQTNQTSTTLWLRYLNEIEISNQTMVQLTPFGWGVSEANPCWAPDSSAILLISNRDPSNIYYPGASSQVWQMKIPTKGSNPELPSIVSNYPRSVTNLLCSPLGNYIAFSANVIPGLSMSASAQVVEQAESGSLRAYLYDKLFIRHWGDWYHGERSHPFLQSISWNSSNCAVVGDPVDIIFDLDSDVPTKPFGGIEEWSFAPDESEFSYTRRYDETSAAAWTTNLDIWLVPFSSDENGAITIQNLVCLTEANEAADTQPAYSPDGLWIAYIAQTVPGYESDQNRLKLYNRANQTFVDLTGDWDYSVDSFAWNTDTTQIFVTAGEYARERIYSFDVSNMANPTFTPITSNHSASSLNVLSDNTIVFSYDSMTFPSNIYRVVQGEDPQELTNFNADMLQDTFMSEPIEFSFAGANNDTVYGWILPPTDQSRAPIDGVSPIAFLIHGGPQSSWSDDWSYRWNPQTYAGQGYAVVMVNFHGSTTYGQNFTNSIQADYGGKPFDDLHLGLDYVIATYPFVDATRQVALGASYGGWMINWINGHKWNGEDRFLCLVCHDGIFDQRIFWYETDEIWFPEHDMEGTPLFNNNTNYETWNPSLEAGEWNTPQLVIHGGRDYRIPDTHGIGAFTALQRRNITSKFAFFPTENHWVLTPANSIFWHHTVEDWINSFAFP